MFLFLISYLEGTEFKNIQSILPLSEAISRRYFMEIWSACKCVILL